MPGKGAIAVPKPPKHRRKTSTSAERYAKAIVRRRDVLCRWPACRGGPYEVLEVAHLTHKGIGGDPSGARSQPDRMILLCLAHHRGTWGIDRKRAKIVPLTKQGTAGKCEFFVQQDGDWISAGVN